MSLKQLEFNNQVGQNHRILERHIRITKNVKNTKLLDSIE